MPKRKTHEQFCNEVYELSQGEYSVIGEYERADNPILMRNNKCGFEWKIRPGNFLTGYRCPKCAGNMKKSHEQFQSEIEEIFNGAIDLVGTYETNTTKITCSCKICGNVWDAWPENLLRGHGCMVCAHNKLSELFMKSDEEFQKELEEIHLGKITALEKYAGNKKKIKFQCNVCGNIWLAAPLHIIYGKRGCPVCAASHGERETERFLREHNIAYETQKTFPDLFGEYMPLRYDFYLPGLNILIEYQGEFHDGNVRCQTKEELSRRQLYDERKRKYAEDNNIDLLEIWYYDFDNMQQILEEKLLGNQRVA